MRWSGRIGVDCVSDWTIENIERGFREWALIVSNCLENWILFEEVWENGDTTTSFAILLNPRFGSTVIRDVMIQVVSRPSLSLFKSIFSSLRFDVFFFLVV